MLRQPQKLDFKDLPKVEHLTLCFSLSFPVPQLHAHLSGSISRRCLHGIWSSKKAAGLTTLEDPLLAMPEDKHNYCLKTFFPLFTSYIYGLLDDLLSVTISTRDVLRQFAADGVCYLELRTTPRSSAHFSRAQHIRAVADTVRSFAAATPRMHVRLLLSLDRRDSAADARETLRLAREHRDVVVGIDLCGTPTVRSGRAIRFFDAFMREARRDGFALAVHFGEVRHNTTCDGQESNERRCAVPPAAAPLETGEPQPLGPDGCAPEAPQDCSMAISDDDNVEDIEQRIMLGWQPQRLGHVVHVSERVKQYILAQGSTLTLEMCLSCNVHAKMVDSYDGHHFQEWWRAGANLTLGTDDVGVFGSSLSREYELAAQHFNLSADDIKKLARMSIDGIFGGEEEKARLRAIMW
ncbi:hypothetical protein TD95_001553 [Thielaviopsis punctulata]|uniref:Adenosine deaminase domain-containing protein n=1 Tax=Thielaviopsis punctulata TaxID=72032 RepID=A0A0F4ZBX7_9PEZI|nr:hypothetical protein TD95_001553 [Thielaviopsis punctulata]